MVEQWNFKNINGINLFAITNRQAFNSFYQVIKNNEDSILSIKCINCKELITAKMVKEKNATKIEKETSLNKISKSKWVIEQILKTDTIFLSTEPTSGFIPYNSLVDKKMTFEFSENNSFSIEGLKNMSLNGNWHLSSSGNEIILNDGKFVNDYIDILSIEDEFMEISNLNWFRSNETYEDLQIYYEVRLKNNGG